MLFIDQTELVILLAVCTVAAACFIAAISLSVWIIVNRRRKKSVRELAEISIDADAAKRVFTIGEEFNCEGLIVNAVYNLKPTTEQLSFEVITADYFSRLSEAGVADGCYVVKPDMSKEGNDIVIIKYRDKATYYEISVVEPEQEPVQEEPVQEEPVQEEPEQVPMQEEPAQEIIVRRHEPIVIEEESYESVLRYNKSFMAKYIQSSDEIKIWYTTLKNELLSYKKVRSRISWKRETFYLGREAVARFSYRGKTLCMYFPLDPNEFADTKYKVEDVSDLGSYEDTPCMYRLKNKRRVRYAIELIALVMERKGGIRIERIAEDYYLPYEGIVELIGKGLAKRIIKKKSEEPRFLQGSAAEVAAAIVAEDEGSAEQRAEEEAPEEEEPVEEPAPVEEKPAEEEAPEEEEPVQEPAPQEEPVIEELSKSEIRDVETYKETEKDEDGIEVVGVMFRRRGRKVYWFDPAGKTWEKGEIALYRSPNNPPQEVIVVDNARRSPSKLHLPLKPLYKAIRRPQPRKKR